MLPAATLNLVSHTAPLPAAAKYFNIQVCSVSKLNSTTKTVHNLATAAKKSNKFVKIKAVFVHSEVTHFVRHSTFPPVLQQAHSLTADTVWTVRTECRN